MTNIRMEQTQVAINNYLHKSKLETLVKRTGIGSKAIKNMIAGNWKEVEPEWWQKVNDAVYKDVMSGLYQTKDCQAIIKLCEHAQKNRLMLGLTGDTGMGKTHTLQAVAGKENVFYMELDPTVTPKVFLSKLLQDMRTGHECSLNEMLNMAAKELNRRHSPLLIIDEAAKLSQKLMLCLHALRDKTKDNCGIVLAGMPELKNMLIRGAETGRNGYSEFFRRVNMWHELRGLRSDEIGYVLNDSGITDAELQREFRKHTRFADLVNEIKLFKVLND